MRPSCGFSRGWPIGSRRSLPRETAPSLIHGDLWSGNVLHTARGPALVDPACAYADREMEFGITTLFGGFDDRFFAAYEEAWPLPGGWRERNPLYQLYHLLNHFLIFGGAYGGEALSLARRYGVARSPAAGCCARRAATSGRDATRTRLGWSGARV